MTMIKARGLLTAVMAARAICGLSVAQGQSATPIGYTVTGTTAGGGKVILGSGAGLSGLESVLATGGFNNVTLKPGSLSSERLTFTDMSNNVLLNQGNINISSTKDEGVLFEGDNVDVRNNSVTNTGTIRSEGPAVMFRGNSFVVSDNSLTNSGIIFGTYGDGVVFTGSEVTGNQVTNSGTISGGDGYGGMRFEALSRDSADHSVSGNHVNNSGTITGVNSGYGILLEGDTISNNTVTNSGTIRGGDGYYGSGSSSGGDGIRFQGTTVSGNTVTNSGFIQGGNSSGDSGGFGAALLGISGPGGYGRGDGISFFGSTVSSNTVNNSGTISGNFAGIGFGFQGMATLVVGGEEAKNIDSSDVSQNHVINSGTISSALMGVGFEGMTVGDNSVTNSGRITSGMGVTFLGVEEVTGNTVTNSGIIDASFMGLGFYGATVSDNRLINSGIISVGEKGKAGIVFDSNGTDTTLRNTVLNSGVISTGNGTNGVSFESDIFSGTLANSVTNTGSIIAGDNSRGVQFLSTPFGSPPSNNFAIMGRASDAVEQPFGDVSGNSVINAGTIATGDQGTGILFAGEHVGDNTVNNTGTVMAGINGAGVVFNSFSPRTTINNTLTNVGSITVGDAINGRSIGVFFEGDNVITNTVTNSGSITAGNGIESGEGMGIWFAGNTVSNNTVNNFGSITVGTGGIGVSFTSDGSGEVSGNTLNNWGTITAGVGGTAIYVEGHDNTINLNGHSNVNGMIVGAVGGSNNVLNMNFTGLSAAAQKALRDELEAQGALYGPVNGVITCHVRGMLFQYDPLVLNLNLSSYQQQGLTANQGAIGANLDSLTVNPTGGLLTLINAVDQSGNVPLAVEALSPQRYQLYGDIATATMATLTQQVDQRMAFLNSVQLSEKRWNLFLGGGYKDAKVDGTGNGISDAKFTSDSVLLGVDYRVSSGFTLGGLFHYTKTDQAKLDTQGSTADVDSYGLGLYAGYRQGGLYGNGLLTYTNNKYKSSRAIVFPGFSSSALGETKGHQIGLDLDGGQDFSINDKLTAGPLAGLQYVHLNVNGFNEHGSVGGDLAVNDQSMTSLQARLGGHLTFRGTSFSADLHAAFQHEFENNSRDITATFIGSGLAPFSVKTTEPKGNAIVLGAGINFNATAATSLFLSYDLQAGQSYYHAQDIKGGVKMTF